VFKSGIKSGIKLEGTSIIFKNQALYNVRYEIKDEVRDEVREYVINQIQDQVSDQIWYQHQPKTQIQNPVYVKVDVQFFRQVLNQFKSEYIEY